MAACDFRRTSTTTPRTKTDKDLDPTITARPALHADAELRDSGREEIQYQLCENLVGDTFGRYMAPTNDGWKQNHATFNASLAWLSSAFNVLPNIYSAWFKKLRALTGKGEQFALSAAAAHCGHAPHDRQVRPYSEVTETRSLWPTIRRDPTLQTAFSTIWTT